MEMKALATMILELLRIVIVIGFLGILGWLLIENIYSLNDQVESYSWLGAIALLLLLFILYRNKLQFSGFYKGKHREKLPKNVFIVLTIVAMGLFISPFIIGTA